jgi:hypothetical protein
MAPDTNAQIFSRLHKAQSRKPYAVWINSEKLSEFKDTKGQPAVPYVLVFKTRDK